MNANNVLIYLSGDILRDGKDVPSRAGNTKELTFVNFEVSEPQDRYITVPGRNVSVPAQIAETMWVLAGRNDVEWLSAYLPQAPKFADDGKHWRAGYGPRLRSWDGTDQLKEVINLLKRDPTTRRAVISLWDPRIDINTDSKDVPCNNWLHFLARDGVLHLSVSTRSNDLMWGWSGINFFEWSVLLEIVATHAGLKLGKIHFNVSSMHLYERHFQKAEKIASEKFFRSDESLITFPYQGWNTPISWLDENIKLWFEIEAEIRNGKISRIGEMHGRDGLLWSWLWAIAYYWGIEGAENAVAGFSLWPALEKSPKRKKPEEEQNLELLTSIMCRLHTEKSAAYGNSWKKRGEIFSILPNIARKVDRIIANTETSDETKLDTAMDLVIYLAKYQHRLNCGDKTTTESENSEIAATLRRDKKQGDLSYWFEELLICAEAHGDRSKPLNRVISIAVNHLMELWNGPEGRAYRNENRSWKPE